MKNKKPVIAAAFAHPVDRKLAAGYLSGLGYELVEFPRDGAPAADLFILDVPSAHRFGSQVIALKKKTDVFLPAMIALGRLDPVDPWLAAGFDDSLRMPFTKAQLKANVAILLRLRHQSMELAQKGEEKYRAIFEATGTATLLVEEDTTILMANQECLRVTGYSPDELIGTKWTAYVAPESLDELLAYHKARREVPEKAPHQYEARLVDKAGRVRTAYLSVGLAPGTSQSIVSMVDITERVQAQMQLRRQNEKLALLLEISATLSGPHETGELFQSVVDGAAKLLPSGSAAIYLVKDDSLHLEAVWPELPPDFPESLRQAPLSDHPHIRQAVSTGSPVIVGDTHKIDLTDSEKKVRDLRGLRSLLYLPLMHQGQPFGVLIAGSADSSHRFSDDEVAIFCTLSNQISLEAEAARLLEENQRQFTELKDRIDQQRQTEKSLRESEALFRNLFQKHVAVKLLIDPDDGRIMDANEAAAKFYSWPQEELHRMKISDIDTLSPLQVKAEMEKARAQERVYFEFKHRRADGSVRDVAVFSSKIESEGKDLLHSIIHDITERKRAEAEVQRLTMAIEQTGEVILVTDPEGTIQYVNPAFEAVTGYTRREAIGQTPRLLKSGKQDEAFYRDLWETIAGGRIWQGRMVNQRKDGGLYTEETTISPVKDGSGRIINFVAVKRDITEHLRNSQAQARLQEQLQQAQKMESIGRLAGGVAHDFNNMLSIIIGYGDLVYQKLHPGDPLREKVEEILKAGRRSADLTRQLLAFSRKQSLQPKVLDLNEVIRNIEKMLRRLIGEDLGLETVLSGDLPRVKVDPGQIEQVIMNLAVNARDAMPRGGKLLIETNEVELDDAYAQNHPSVAPGKYVMLALSDTGCGMEKEVLAHIFDPFFTTKEKGKGTGLGLATVYGIVKQSGGNIWAYSEPGQGSTFKIYLPVTGDQAEALAGEAAQKEPAVGGEHILVVEDEAALRGLFEAILSRLGYKVTLAANGGEALLLVEEKGLKPDLVITDVVMPGMSGSVLSGRLRRKQPDLKVLFMSGYTDNAIVHHGVLDPGTPFIQKPFTPRNLAEKVRAVLRKNQKEKG
jgi:two-component system cell cycle sensor histidine kinase/response regulator CckA